MRKPPHQKESLKESKQRRLDLEILESRILYSGAPAPSPVPEPSVQQQEVDESGFSEPAVPQDESTDTADPVALEPTPDSEDTSLELVGLVNSDSVLTPEVLTEMVNAATQRWIDSGISDAQMETLESVTYLVADLGGNRLGFAEGSIITIDDDAAGSGSWFIDYTPDLDEEFEPTQLSTLNAISDTLASGSYDLLTVLLHEQGHVLGLEDDRAGSVVMQESLGMGERFVILVGEAAGATPLSIPGSAMETATELSIDDVALAEGNSGTTDFVFTVTRTGDTTGTSSVAFTVAGGGGNQATSDDFDGGAFPAGTVNFAVGETAQTVTIGISGDSLVEFDESFSVTLSNPVDATIVDGVGLGTIISDDSSLSIGDVFANEGTGGITDFDFVVTRTGGSLGSSSANYTVNTGGVNQATAADFAGGFPSGTVVFADGETTQTISIEVIADATVELGESFLVTLSDPVDTDLGDSLGFGTIINDDIANLTVSAADVFEGDVTGDERQLVFDVTLDKAVDAALSVDFKTVNGSAGNGTGESDNDYVTSAGTLNFSGSAGETLQITVDVNEDTNAEIDESMEVVLSNVQSNWRSVLLGNGPQFTWQQIGADIDGRSPFDNYGGSISFSADGNTIAIGSDGRDIASGNIANAGHVRVLQNISGVWMQVGEDIEGSGQFDYFGGAVSGSEPSYCASDCHSYVNLCVKVSALVVDN